MSPDASRADSEGLSEQRGPVQSITRKDSPSKRRDMNARAHELRRVVTLFGLSGLSHTYRVIYAYVDRFRFGLRQKQEFACPAKQFCPV